MKRKIVSIWSVLLILVVSVAVLVPGCEGEIPLGVIEVRATLDGSPWTGPVEYILTPASGSPFGGTSVNKTFVEDPGEWTCAYISGGPGTFVDITPTETQTLAEGETITFTLNFEQCGINVEATLCDAPWSGAVDYALTGPGSPINGTSTPASFNVECGNWTCSYDGGGPPGAFLVDITPDPIQEVTGGGNITFTLNFELEQDAWIDIAELPWTLNGMPLPPTTPPDTFEYEAFPCDIIDVHFEQGVQGCEGYLTAVNETSWLFIHFVGYIDDFIGPMAPDGPVLLYVVNDDCAVDKTAEPPAGPPDKMSQMTTLFGTYIGPGEYIELTEGVPVEVDVETIWTLVKEVDYLKSVNWFGISLLFDWLITEDAHECVLFELIVPHSPIAGGTYHFQLQAAAELELMDDEDVNPGNNDTVTPILDLYVRVPGP
jgi:hypothetical protein